MTTQIQRKQTLAELLQDAMNLSKVLIESDGELTPEIEQALAVNESSLAEKLDAYVYRMDCFEAQEKIFKQKSEEFARIAKQFVNARDRLKANIKQAMAVLGASEIKGEDYRFRLSSSKPKLVVDESNLPSEFMMPVTDYVADKERIRETLEAGKPVKGAHMEPVTQLRRYLNGVSK